MDFVEGLPKSQGKEVILVVVDRLSKYGHCIALPHPYSALIVAQAFLDQVFKLHGCPEIIVSDRNKVFLSKFWEELMKKLGVRLTMSTAYHPQTDGQSEVLNRCLETYLRCMTADKPKEWSKWLPLAEYWAQDKMRSQANKHRKYKELEVGSWVYLKLKPYRQLSVARRPFYKLFYRYFGPYQILKRIGQVAYQLALPPSSKIHQTFHISQLKQHICPILASTDLPDFDEEGNITLQPQAILDRKVINRNNKPVIQVLVHWYHTFPEDATWMDFQKFSQQFPTFIEDP
ncbi:Ty3/gypsy retrotransposon protein [Quillaja saponaria]|uniref:Ty3/gypsy retrotransposon protein n=1 Tax=Quillaja saponaria TaxID=32244 RepID=A0AAD7LQA2_QUISA|nr:Ty3/gypsy retrotransposon protein [Quillaja saponaria]